jgi:hypothetical protein
MRNDKIRRLAGRAAVAVAAFLGPWCAVLGATLPDTTKAHHWAQAWVGLDLAIALSAAATAVLLGRRDPRAALAAAAAGTLLLADAWFDVCTSAPGADHALALAEAWLVEVPLAVAALWLADWLLRAQRNSSSRAVTESNTARSSGLGA